MPCGAAVRPAGASSLDPAGRVLLLGARLTDPAVPPGDVLFWYTPGGGVEDGESAAARPPSGSWPRRSAWSSTRAPSRARCGCGGTSGRSPAWTIDSRETYFVLRDVVHEVDAGGRTELELLGDEPHRWWTAEEIAASGEDVRPRRARRRCLPELLAGPWTGPPRIVA